MQACVARVVRSLSTGLEFYTATLQFRARKKRQDHLLMTLFR